MDVFQETKGYSFEYTIGEAGPFNGVLSWTPDKRGVPNSRCLSYSPHLLPLLYPPYRSTVGWHHQSVTPALFLPDPAIVTVPVSFFAHSACTKERTGSSGYSWQLQLQEVRKAR